MSRFVPTWYLIVWIVASTVGLVIGGIVYTNFAIQREREGSIARQCQGIRDEIELYTQNPPETDRQRESQAYWLDRFDETCAGEKKP
jgi:hypothetical protein